MYSGTRELKLIIDVVDRFKADDEKGFSDKVFAHDDIYKLDKTIMKLLWDVRKFLMDGPKGKGVADDDDQNFQ